MTIENGLIEAQGVSQYNNTAYLGDPIFNTQTRRKLRWTETQPG